MPPIPTPKLTEQQAQALADFVAARGPPTGPWIALLRSPELMTRARGLSDYLRFESQVPGRLLRHRRLRRGLRRRRLS